MVSDVFNMDCMEYMRTLPDKFFDLAIADPPYGLPARSTHGRGKLKTRILNADDIHSSRTSASTAERRREEGRKGCISRDEYERLLEEEKNNKK